MKKISIIIPCYNVSHSVYSSWESVKNQTMGLDEIECIFVDDASTDEGATWQVLERIESEAPESVKVIKSEVNMRQGGARNIGLQYVDGAYMMFLDADDTYSEDACESLYNKAVKGDFDIIQSKHNMVGDYPTPDDISDKTSENSYDLTDDSIRTLFLINAVGDFGCTNKFYRMELVRRANVRFAEHLVYEEPLFVYPLFAYAEKVLITDEMYYQYNWHENSTMTSLLGPRLLDHPNVQLQLVEDMIHRSDIFEKYYYAVMLHFLHSYYAETLLFARVNRGANLELDYFHMMQSICLKLFPDYRKNPLVPISSGFINVAIESIEKKIETREEFIKLLDDVARSAGCIA